MKKHDLQLLTVQCSSSNRCRNLIYLFLLLLGSWSTTVPLLAQAYIDCATVTQNAVTTSQLGAQTVDGFTYLAITTPDKTLPIINGQVPSSSNTSVGEVYVAIYNENCTQVLGSYLGGDVPAINASNTTTQVIDIEVDANGNLILKGNTQSADLLVTDNSTQGSGPGNATVFLAKYNPTTGLVFSTIPAPDISGSSGPDIKATPNGDVVLSLEPDVAVFDQFTGTDGTDNSNGSRNIILLRYDGAGNVLFSTVISGSEDESSSIVAADDNFTYIVLETRSEDLPTTDGSTYEDETDLYWAKYDNSGNLVAAAYTPNTAGFERIDDLLIAAGEIYIIGDVGTDFAYTDETTAATDREVALLKYDAAGQLVYALNRESLVGTTDGFPAQRRIVNGDIYTVSGTSDASLPVVNGETPVLSNLGLYISRMDTDGNVIFATYYSGDNNAPPVFEVNPAEEIYLIAAGGVDFLTTDGTVAAGRGAVIAKFNADGSFLAATALNEYRASGSTAAQSITVDGNTVIFPFIHTNFAGIPDVSTTTDRTVIAGPGNVSVINFEFCPTPPTITTDDLTPAVQNVCQNSILEVIEGDALVYDGTQAPPVFVNGVQRNQPDLDLEYQWQFSFDNATWTDVPGALAKLQNYSPPPTAIDVFYRRLTRESECCGNGSVLSTSSSAFIDVDNNMAPTIDAGGTFYTCPGAAVTIGGSPTITGGTAPFTIDWDQGATDGQANPTVSPTISTVYTVDVIDANNCIQNDQATVVVYAANAGTDQNTCAGDAVTIGGAPLTGVTIVDEGSPIANEFSVAYTWTGNTATLSCTNCPNPVATTSSEETYDLKVTIYRPDGSSCFTTDDVTVSPFAPITDFAGPDRLICLGETTTLGAPEQNVSTATLAAVTNQSSRDGGNNLNATVARLTDGNFTTGGRTNDGIGENIVLDLGSVQTINFVELGGLSNQFNGYNFDIEISTDNVNYTSTGVTISAFFGNLLGEDANSIAKYFFPVSEVRYVRLINNIASFGDVEVSEFAAGLGYGYIWGPVDFIDNSTSAQVTFDAGNLQMPAVNPITYTVTAFIGDCETFDQVSVAIIEARAGVDGCGPRLIGEPDRTPNINETYSWRIIPGLTTGDNSNFTGVTNAPVVPVSGNTTGETHYELTTTFTFGGQTIMCKDTVIVPPCGCVVDVETEGGGCPDFDNNNGPVTLIATARAIGNPSNLDPDNFTYTWMPMAGLNTSNGRTVILQDNVERTYTVTATSLIDPSFTCDVNVPVNLPTFTDPVAITQDKEACSAEATSIGGAGNPNFSYQWAPSAFLDNATIANPMATITNNTDFIVTVTDISTGCVTIDTSSITVAQVAAAGPDLAVCDQAIVTIGANAELPGYTYAWSPAFTGLNGTSTSSAQPELEVSTNQTYMLTVTSPSGCVTTDEVVITVENRPAPFSLTDVDFCPSITPVILGWTNSDGTGTNEVPTGAGIEYAWQPAAFLNDATLRNPTVTTPLPSTPITFTLEVRSGPGCNQTATQTITPTVATPIVAVDQAICLGEMVMIGSASNTTAGGVTYSWMPATELDDATSPNPTFTPTTAGDFTYEVTRTEAGCSSTAEVTITVEDITAPTVSPVVVCQGDMPAIGVADEGFDYSWSPTTGLSDPNIPNPTFTGSASQNYTLTISNARGCFVEVPISVTVSSNPPPTVTIDNLNVCTSTTSSVILDANITPSGDYTFQWSPTTFLSNPNVEDPTFFIPGEGIYEYTVVVTDQATGCTGMATVMVTSSLDACLNSIGSTVWSDVNDNGMLDSGEQGIENVTVQVVSAGIDGMFGTADDVVEGTATTDANGDYYIGGLAVGSYQVVIPATQFGSGGALESTPVSSTFNSSIVGSDDDDNGIQVGGMGTEVRSNTITLTLGGQPTDAMETGQGGMQDDGISNPEVDENGDMTVDFGFTPVLNVICEDVIINGATFSTSNLSPACPGPNYLNFVDMGWNNNTGWFDIDENRPNSSCTFPTSLQCNDEDPDPNMDLITQSIADISNSGVGVTVTVAGNRDRNSPEFQASGANIIQVPGPNIYDDNPDGCTDALRITTGEEITFTTITFTEAVPLCRFFTGGNNWRGAGARKNVSRLTAFDGPNGTGNPVLPNFPNPADGISVDPNNWNVATLNTTTGEIFTDVADDGSGGSRPSDERGYTFYDYNGAMVRSIVFQSFGIDPTTGNFVPSAVSQWIGACESFNETVCFSETVELCDEGSSTITLTAPAQYTNVTWFDESNTQVATGNTFEVDINTAGLQDGQEAYFFRAFDMNGSPIAELCCPVLITVTSCTNFDCEAGMQVDIDAVGIEDDTQVCIDVTTLGIDPTSVTSLTLIGFSDGNQPTSFTFTSDNGINQVLSSPTQTVSGTSGVYYTTTVVGDGSTNYCAQTAGGNQNDGRSFQVIVNSTSTSAGGSATTTIFDYVFFQEEDPDCVETTFTIEAGSSATKEVVVDIIIDDIEVENTPNATLDLDITITDGGGNVLDMFTNTSTTVTGELLKITRTVSNIPQNVIELNVEVCSSSTGGNNNDGESAYVSAIAIDYSDVCTEDAPLGAIGNYVYIDEDSDGFQDEGEVGIPNVAVVLYGDANGDGTVEQIAVTYTDSDGKYLFPDLPAGTYYVDVLDGTSNTANTLPNAGLTQTSGIDSGTSQPTQPTNSVDADSDGVFDEGDLGNKDHTSTSVPDNTGITGYEINLATGEENLTADFGYNYNPTADVNDPSAGTDNTAALGDRVWIDSDGDGVQDPNEIGVSGVQITLTGAGADGIFGTGDDVTATTTTDENGFYIFDNLTPGAYMTEVTSSDPVVTGVAVSHDILNMTDYDQTGDPDHFGTSEADNPDDSVEDDNKQTKAVVLGPGDVYLNSDYGYQPIDGQAPVGSIGNTVWLDADADGNGPSDSSIGVTGGTSDNGLGTDDSNETPIEGVSVALIDDVDGDGVWDADGDDDIFGTADDERIVATDVTDAQGQYLFEGLPLDKNGTESDYLVWVNDTENVLDGLRPTYDGDDMMLNTTDPEATGIGDDANMVLGLSDVTISSGTPDDQGQDFGYTPAGNDAGEGFIGDFVWFDTDRSGTATPDAGEAGIEGVVMELLDVNGDVIATTTTNENGFYLFGDLPLDDGVGAAGADYTVRVASSNFDPMGVLEDLETTFEPGGGNQNDNQGAVVTLSAGTPGDLDQDFSYAGDDAGTLGSIGSTIWEDTDNDGVYEPLGTNGVDDDEATEISDDENPLAGVTVDLIRDLNGNGQIDPGEPVIGTATTDAMGNYLFENLPMDDYIVEVTDEAGIVAGFFSSPVPSTDANTNTTGSGAMETADDAMGTPGGDQSKPDAFAVTLDDNGGTADVVNNLNVDFGYYKEPAAVGNFVFNDTNSNGIQDNGETGIEGVSVTLDITYPDGIMVRVVTITDANGFYEFPNLLLDEDYSMGAGNPEDNPSSPSANMPQYKIFINTVGQDNTGEPLGDLVPTAVDAQGTGQQPSDAENINGVNAVPKQGSEDTTAEVDETMEANEAQYDFGFTTGLVGIGGTIWADQGTGGGTQNDGTQDGGELGIAGVTLELLNDVGTVIATTTTNADGTYLFEGLQPGDYQVRIPSSNFDDMGNPLQALPFSSVPTTTTNNDDSDNDDNGSQAVANGAVTSPIFTLSVGGEPSGADEILTPTQDGSDGSARDLNTNTTVDFGFQDLVLPVELLYFQARADKDHIDLIWSTASEINNSHFDIERSEDGKTFKSIAQVQGSGTTLEQTDYKHEDREAIPNVLYYYRLKQVDFDGAFEYSEIRAAKIESDRSGIALYPNPIGVNQALQVRFFAKDTEASFVIMDIHSKPIIRVEEVLNTVGWHTIQIDITKLAAGTYLLVSDSGETMRFIITEE